MGQLLYSEDHLYRFIDEPIINAVSRVHHTVHELSSFWNVICTRKYCHQESTSANNWINRCFGIYFQWRSYFLSIGCTDNWITGLWVNKVHHSYEITSTVACLNLISKYDSNHNYWIPYVHSLFTNTFSIAQLFFQFWPHWCVGQVIPSYKIRGIFAQLWELYTWEDGRREWR